MNPIPTELIEKALALTGKTMEDMGDRDIRCMDDILSYASGRELDFSYHKFYAYLLSPEFIEKYNSEYCDTINCDKHYTAGSFGQSIYQHQSGNSQPLIDLLTKI